MATPTEMRKGKVIFFNNKPYLVTSIDHRTPGRRPSFVQAGLKCLKDGTNLEHKFLNSDTVTFMETNTKPMEFSYVDEEGLHFMDLDSFEDNIIPESMVEDIRKFMVEGQTYDVLFVDGKSTRVELPASVDMEVTESPDAVRGDTSSAPTKAVTLQTGIVVQTPLFIKKGELIRISTIDGSYQGRSKE